MIKTVLLTGATGFFGSHLCERLVHDGYNVIILKRSTSDTWRIADIMDQLISYDIDKTPLSRTFIDNEINAVIHAATNYGRKKESIPEIVDANLMFPLQVLELASKNNVEVFLNTDTTLSKDINYYSLSKKQYREWLKKYSERLKIFNLKLEHLYGEKDSTDKFITMVIDSFLKSKEEIKLTEGDQVRDFVYVGDVVQAYIKILGNLSNHNKQFTGYSLGSGTGTTIREIVGKIKSLTNNTGTRTEFGAIKYRKNEIMKSVADISKVSKDLGWIPRTSLESGLQKTVEWQARHI